MKKQENKHEFYKRFSFPLNSEEIQKDISYYKIWFYKHKHLIKEMYFTLNDFGHKYMTDMNGDEIVYDYRDFLKYIKSIGIKTTLTINNIFEINKIDNNILSIIQENKELIDIIIAPNEKWVSLLKNIKKFYIKNTVVHIPDETFIQKYHNIYDEIYIHDEIMHNHDKFLELKRKYQIKLGTVVNFIDCATYCVNKQKHYELVHKKQYDSNLFCPTKQFKSIEELLLKRNSIPGFYYSYKQYLDVIDTYKLQGRVNSVGQEYNKIMKLIENINKKSKILLPEYKILYSSFKSDNVFEWQKTVLNCGGICPECDFCNNLLLKKDN